MREMLDRNRYDELMNNFANEPIVSTPVPFQFKLEALKKGFAIVSMEVTEGMLVGGVGIVNGGIMDALGNTASVYAAMSAIPAGHMPRMNFSVRNNRAAKAGETLLAIAELELEAPRSIVVSFRIFKKGDSEDVKATGSGQYHKPKEE